MTLTDTGPLVALIDKRDGYHAKITGAMKTIRLPLLTTEACLTETMHFYAYRLEDGASLEVIE